MRKLIGLAALATMSLCMASAQLFPGDNSVSTKDVDVNYPDHTHVKAGERITKTWLIFNNGSVDWSDRELRVVEDSTSHSFAKFKSERFSAKYPRPGQRNAGVKVSVAMNVPTVPGHYVIYFKQWATDPKDKQWKLAFPTNKRYGVWLDIYVD